MAAPCRLERDDSDKARRSGGLDVLGVGAHMLAGGLDVSHVGTESVSSGEGNAVDQLPDKSPLPLVFLATIGAGPGTPVSSETPGAPADWPHHKGVTPVGCAISGLSAAVGGLGVVVLAKALCEPRSDARVKRAVPLVPQEVHVLGGSGAVIHSQARPIAAL